jgi:hypothetical protein
MTERSMPLSANRWAYSLRPIDASHSAMPFMALALLRRERPRGGRAAEQREELASS